MLPDHLRDAEDGPTYSDEKGSKTNEIRIYYP